MQTGDFDGDGGSTCSSCPATRPGCLSAEHYRPDRSVRRAGAAAAPLANWPWAIATATARRPGGPRRGPQRPAKPQASYIARNSRRVVGRRTHATANVWAMAAAAYDGDGRATTWPWRAAHQPGPAWPHPPTTPSRSASPGKRYQRGASQPTGLWPLALLAANLAATATDLVSADYGGGQASLFRGDGRGGVPPGRDPGGRGDPAGLASGTEPRWPARPAGRQPASGKVTCAAAAIRFSCHPRPGSPVGSNPWALALANFDADAALDLAVAGELQHRWPDHPVYPATAMEPSQRLRAWPTADPASLVAAGRFSRRRCRAPTWPWPSAMP